MLPVTDDTVRIFLHVVGASVWIGGQVVLDVRTATRKAEARRARQLSGITGAGGLVFALVAAFLGIQL